ncbi:MAG: alpha/beta hydrolase, partial [Clostridia bacterium]|nr:alpha/beta hydrolase [Clostridia bacterium]
MYFQKYGQGLHLLFLHGWGCDGDVFRVVAQKLPNNSSYLVDFVGFGKSAKPPVDGWTVLDYANDVLQFLDEQKLEQVTIVAHSFGCRVAMVLAALYPSRVRKLLLFAPAGLRKPSLKRWCKVAKYKIYKFLCKIGGCQNVSARFGSADYLACEDARKNTFVKVVNQDLSKYAKEISCPTLIINGKNDKQTPPKHAKA